MNNNFDQIKTWFLLISMLYLGTLQAQSPQEAKPLTAVTLQECYEWSRQNYPLVKKLDLLERSTQYSLSNASKINLPQININGQATYQSEVTEVPIEMEGLEIPTIDKDQYKLYGEVYQPLTNFKGANAQKDLIDINGQIEQQKVEVNLYQLKDRINQIYFGVLLMDAKNEHLALVQIDIDSTLAKLVAAIENGIATLMDQQLLRVEKINIAQQLDENKSNKEAYLKMLSTFTGQPIDLSTQLIRPEIVEPKLVVSRPELQLFGLQEKRLDVQQAQINIKNIPSVGLFVQGGLGRPALNFLSNEFSPYYIAGIKFNWNFTNRYTSKNDHQLLAIQRQLIDKEKAHFLHNTEITQHQQSSTIRKYERLLNSDNELVELRTSIKKTAKVQLINGLITTIDYIKILNDASRAKQQLDLHHILLLQAQHNLQTTIGH